MITNLNDFPLIIIWHWRWWCTYFNFANAHVLWCRMLIVVSNELLFVLCLLWEDCSIHNVIFRGLIGSRQWKGSAPQALKCMYRMVGMLCREIFSTEVTYPNPHIVGKLIQSWSRWDSEWGDKTFVVHLIMHSMLSSNVYFHVSLSIYEA